MRLATCIVAWGLALALSACAGNGPQDPKEPIRLDLTIVAAPTVNPDDQGRATPIVVRIYELKTGNVFTSADYFSLQDSDRTLLVDDLVVREEFQLRPGERKAIRHKAGPTTTALGVLAAYRNLPNSVWRVTYPLPPAPEAVWYRWSSPKVKLTIDLGPHAIKVTEGK